jgi:transposase
VRWEFVITPTLSNTDGERVVRRRTRRDPKPRFKPDSTHQLDAINGCPAVAVPPDHLAWRVQAEVARLDVSTLEASYSSLGRHGYHPRNVLAVWLYASLIGMRHSTKVGLACKTDAAFRLLSGGHAISSGVLRRFRRENGAFFAQAIGQTVAMAHERGLLHTDELAVDSMRLRAHASTKAVRTLARSKKRLAELASVDVATLDDDARKKHEAKLAKHRDAVEECEKRGRTSIVTTNESAALMKFPSGAALPGHRITITAAGVTQRIVIGVLVDAATTDYGKLGPALLQAREVLLGAGVAKDVRLQAAADAGYIAGDDYAFAADNREWVDVLIPVVEGKSPQEKRGYWGRERFVINGDEATCPAGKRMLGPRAESDDRIKWLGVGCDACPLKSQCTEGKVRTLSIHRQTELAMPAMRERWQQPGARERYNERIATVEPVFANLEETMGFRRASSRHDTSIVAEVLLNVLAHNLSRLAAARKLSCVWCSFEPEF